MDEDSDTEQSEAAAVEKLGKKLTALKTDSEKGIKAVRDEFLRKFAL